MINELILTDFESSISLRKMDFFLRMVTKEVFCDLYILSKSMHTRSILPLVDRHVRIFMIM